ncbi:MAG: hypothetical protein ACI4FX_00525 [Agathobacter sp.]
MRKNIWFISFLSVFSLLLINTTPVFAAQCNSSIISSTYYTETIIMDEPNYLYNLSTSSTSHTITKTKTTNMKDVNGSIVWSVSVTGTFTYNGDTSTCIKSSHKAFSYASSWKIKTVSSSQRKNSATAVAIATHSSGQLSRDFTQSVTISCSKDGTVY